MLVLVCAPPAQGAPRPLVKLAEHDGFALAGDHVLYTQTVGRTVRVKSMPVAGGAARTVFTFRAGRRLHSVQLRATPQRAAALVYFHTDGAVDGSQVFSGPPGGGWTAVTAPALLWKGASVPLSLQVDGDLLFTQETRTDADDVTAVVRDPAPRDLPYRTGITVFAGDLVAYSAQAPDQRGWAIGRRVVVANWRTGAQLGMSELPDPIFNLALRPDGRVAASTIDSEIYAFLPGQAPARVGAGLPTVAFAGEHVVFPRANGLRIAASGAGRGCSESRRASSSGLRATRATCFGAPMVAC
jgi:hypothetical protein